MRTNSILSSSLGNILEWYDFGLFAIFSSLFSELFFPKQDAYASMIATFSVFAIGFFCRPLGALLFGYLGDRRGRAKTIRLSILMISLPTLLIGCLPAYQTVGILAPILLLVTRIWQGISLGGEYSGNIIYLGELAPPKQRSFFTSLPAVGANLGILMAMIVGGVTTFFFNDATFKTWGWRIPYLISGLFCLLIYATRLNIQETPPFLEMKKKGHLSTNPIASIFKKHRFALLRTLGLVCMGSTFYYFCFIYLPMVLHETFHYSFIKTTHLETLFIGVMIFLVPLAGLLNDHVGRYRMLILNALIITATIVPGLYLLHFGSLAIVIGTLLFFTIASSLEQGTTPAVLVENFPIEERYTGISLAYNLANGFLGGSIPLICSWLVIHTHSFLAPGFYVSGCAVITLCFALTFRKKII